MEILKSELVLTIDVGTTNLKCILFNEEGKEVAKVSLSNTTRYPQPFFAEQDPWQWIENLKLILQNMRQLHPEKLNSIAAIVLTGQMHGPVLIGNNGEALCPCIIWSDARAIEEVEILERKFSPEFFLEKMGNPLQQSFTLPKLLWLKRHYSEVFTKTSKIIFPKDYVAIHFGGKPVTDYSDASGSLLLNLHTKKWVMELWKELGFSPDILPDVVSSESVIGVVSEEAAETFSLPPGIPIIKGSGDLAATALATGARKEGNVSLCVGTAGQLLFCLEKAERSLFGKLYLFLHCINDKYLCLGTVPTGGAALDWFLSLFDIKEPRKLWDKIANTVEIPLRRTLLFYPFLLGTGTPYFDYRAKAAFLGLQMNHKAEDIALTILEGVVFALRESFEVVPLANRGSQPIVLSGGLARLPLLARIVSNVFNRPVVPSRYVDAAPVGAFLMAARALGIINDYEDVAIESTDNIFFPEDPYVQYYLEMRNLYNSFLEAIRSFALKSTIITEGKDYINENC